jgi:23S rRNA (cytosine1962-C5)-methyltransferase
VYRDHVRNPPDAPAGTWVEVRAGSVSAYALWDPGSPLALRIFSHDAVPDERLIVERVREAMELRRITGVVDRATAYRWIYGEGDRLPGIVVDRYGAFAVIATDGAAAETLVPWVVAGLRSVTPLTGILRKVRGATDDERIDVLFGRAPPRDLVVEENGLRFRANLWEGQKTGLFLDQRDNRRIIESLSSGRRVLNLFGYTGAFSLYAARGGASHVTTVDVAGGALRDAAENFRLNALDPDAHAFLAVDAFDYLGECAARRERFDLVVSDPPSFARNRAHRDRASKAYAKLHAAAIRVTEPGGLYAASSCTSQVDADAFRDTLAAAARATRRSLQIVHDAGHAADHPVLPAHPEGRYLKFVVVRVGRAR